MAKRRRRRETPCSDGSDSLATRLNQHNRRPDSCEEAESQSGRRRKAKKVKTFSASETLLVQSETTGASSASSRYASLACSIELRREAKPRRREPSRRGREDRREWAYASRDLSGCGDKVVFVSYNILGVENAAKHQDLYAEVQPRFLKWRRRKKLIREELKLYDADIVCFQEVDRFDDLADLLKKDGFGGVYKARTGEANDGCAIFWKDDRLTLVHQDNIEFKTFGLRDNVAQLCVLKMKQRVVSNSPAQSSESPNDQNQLLLVANIHVLFNPNRGDVKLGQIRLLLEKAHQLSEIWGKIPVIIGGDLNSMPQSAIYQFLASSELDIQLHDRRKISGQIGCLSANSSVKHQNRNSSSIKWMPASRQCVNRWNDDELRLATGSEKVTHLQHHLDLCSAYFGIPGSCRTRDNCGEPLATSYHSRFMGTVDYIWHTKELVPIRVLETLPIDALNRTGGLPSKKWGSDHLALVCELAFLDRAITFLGNHQSPNFSMTTGISPEYLP
ncbi:carbon catabolite repressor protein 4 homolog 5 isoform X3 [Syzygium oleosum]|uniref:carbon catabolite repressor protein 4 homolog 5 isoform X3 n=2 Tax=Syzygium oleosum TaxID=219896 RepID=UPI0024B8C8CB|nr:carbon catabolite repressor protein 4 homolog 5 isoform X3 [Syzygium oleosum]